MEYPKISIVVAIFNRKAYTLKFLESLANVDYPNYDLVIVDDGSTDGSVEEIKSKYPYVNIITGEGDYWWTKSMNVGFQWAIDHKSDYVLIMNNDVEIQKDCLKHLVESAQLNPGAIVGSIIVYKNDPELIWSSGGKQNPLFTKPSLNFFPLGRNINDEKELRDAEFLTGMGTLIPIEVFSKIGLYDNQNLPQYYSDIEFTMRAKKKGVKVLLEPKAIVFNNPDVSWNMPERIGFKELNDIFCHIRSPYQLKATLFMYYNYWPKSNFLIHVFFRYLDIIFPISVRICPVLKKLKKA